MTTIEWSFFALGLLLLLYPAVRLLSSLVQFRNFESFHNLDTAPLRRLWWLEPILWIDPLRSLAGTILLMRSLGISSEDWQLVPKGAYSLLIVLLGFSVVVQTLHLSKQSLLMSPIGFVAGIVAALIPWPVALMGLIMGLTGMFAFRQFHAFFSVSIAIVLILGAVLQVHPHLLAPAIAVLGVPVAISLMTNRPLELPTRNVATPKVS